MNVFRKIKWSLRKLTLPIYGERVVIEVGSGGNPHPLSDVLVEKYISNKHRLKGIEIDKRLILADACKLPFKDKAFDYSLSFHVLEHVDNPKGFLKESARVSHSGYIETPNVIYERLRPFDVHLLEISMIKDVLHINKKNEAYPDKYLNSLGLLDDEPKWKKLFDNYPELFHVQLHWRNKIDFKIYNENVSLEWFQEPESNTAIDSFSKRKQYRGKKNIRKLVLEFLKKIKSSRIEVEDLLVCSECKGDLKRTSLYYICKGCNIRFTRTPIPDFTRYENI